MKKERYLFADGYEFGYHSSRKKLTKKLLFLFVIEVIIIAITLIAL